MSQYPELLLLDSRKPICAEGLLEVAQAYGTSAEDAEALAAAVSANEDGRFIATVFIHGSRPWHTRADTIERALATAIAHIRGHERANENPSGYVPFLCDADLADEEATGRYVQWMLAFEERMQQRIERRARRGCQARAA